MADALFTIAPDADFLATLADRVLDGTLVGDWARTGPFWLTDITIIVPTRRARMGLAAHFSERGHPLLPDIRTFGGDAGDEEPFLPPLDAAPLPPAAGRIERQLTLARLVEAWAHTPEGAEVLATPPFPAEILGLAESMGELIDDITIEGADIGRLPAVLAERELAANWQQTAKLLAIALEAWPQVLAGLGRADAAALRNARLARQAEAASLIYGDRPVIAAGSTGSIPATANLLAAISSLPRGALVLPGLDTTLTPKEEAALADDPANPHGHPQYGLVKLLRRLGAHPGEVVELAPDPAARRRVLREALALADATAGWAAARADLAPRIGEAVAGLEVLAAGSEDEEARAIALAARDGLFRRVTVGIVSPDRGLSRRIAAELARHGIDVDDAAGTPLFQSPAGRLARQTLAAAETGFGPVPLMALLRNRAARFDMPRAEVSRLADRIDLGLLRGQQLGPGIDGLRRSLADNIARRTGHPALKLGESDAAPIGALLDRLQQALHPVSTALAGRNLGVGALVAALATAVEAVVAGATPAELPPGMAELRAFAAEVAAESDAGPRLTRSGLDAVMQALMAGIEVRNAVPRRDDIAIWGQLEARLQHPGLMILAGLNEDIWPAAADPGPWLSRGMRLAIGLEPPERRQGLAAHDFAMALGNPEIVLAWSKRIGTAPARPSRFLQRLEAFIGDEHVRAARARGDRWLDEARRLDRVAAVVHAPRPMPKPLAAWRPHRLAITDIETLIRSPYDLYARHVLKLRPIDALGAPVTGRELGTVIHEVFAAFIRGAHDIMAPDAERVLLCIATAAFAELEALGERRDMWLARFETAARAFLEYERARQPQIRRRHAEIEGQWRFPGGFELRGRADRIDELIDGRLVILDFKTGALPSPKNMRGFMAPQLLLEAAMAEAGGFADVAPGEPTELSFIKIGRGPQAFVPTPFQPDEDLGLAGAIEEVWTRIQRQADAFLFTDSVAMPSRMLPDTGRRYRGDYDHLARADEWSFSGDDEP